MKSGKTAVVLACSLALALIVSGCSSSSGGKKKKNRLRPDRVEVEVEQDEMGRAMQAPLYDLNFKKDEIPAPLADLKNIFTPPPEESCRNMRREIYALNGVLGPEEIVTSDDPEKVLTLNPSGALESAMSSLIPYNDILKYLSGATAHEKKLARAIFRGHARRAFLRGWEVGRGCDKPWPIVKPPKDKRKIMPKVKPRNSSKDEERIKG